MAPRSVPAVIERLRELDARELARVARRCTAMDSAATVEAYLESVGLL
jgi:hypothetical protein